MIRNLCRDDKFLSLKGEEASIKDKQIGIDLVDTLAFHQSTCVGMAANMIGENKRIIAFFDNKKIILMYNPIILRYYGNVYETSEGCLCHNGSKKTKRYEKIQVTYLDKDFKKLTKTFTGFTSQIIQHEMDHLEGILI
jgi:peptide deformylase